MLKRETNTEYVKQETFEHPSLALFEVASRYQNGTNLEACKVCNEGMLEDECHLLFTCLAYYKI